MNGFAGVVRTNGAPLDDALVEALAAAAPYSRSRAPVTWRDATAGLLRFAAPTIAATDADEGLVTDSRSGLVACLDGRLDHRDSMLARLTADLRVTAASTDAALALALFGALGDSFLQTLSGDYAIAIWDARARRLLCARSPGGWRPFYWTHTAGVLAFASEPLTLLRGLRLSPRPNEGAIAEHLAARFTTPTETFWSDVFVLPPGSALDVVNGRARVVRWHEGPADDSAALSDAEHIDRFRRLFDDAILTTARTNGFVTAQLSGGLDSSSVVARAVALARAGRMAMPRIISMRYPAERFDESTWSRAVEAHLNVEAIGLQVSGVYDWDTAEAWTRRTLHLPLRPNVLMQMLASPQWRDLGASLVLTGEGGDDWVSGTPTYLAEIVRDGDVRRLLALVGGPRIAARWDKRLGRVWRYGVRPLLSRDGRERLRRPQHRASHAVPALLSRDWASRIGLVDRWRSVSSAPAASDAALSTRGSIYTLARRQVNWANVIALASDRGVEQRHPLHDLRLTHYLLRAPGELLWRDGVKKWLLREAMRGELPEIVRTRQDKANFSPLIVDALLARVTPDSVRRMAVVERGWIEPDAFTARLEPYRSWQRAGRPATLDTTWLNAMWAIVATDLWLRCAEA